MSAEYPQPQPPAPQGPYMQPGVQPGAGYYPAQGQPQYGPPQQSPGLANFPGQILGLVMVIAGGLFALLGFIMALAGDMSEEMGVKAVQLGNNLLLGGIFLLGLWLWIAIREKAAKQS